MLKIKNVIIVCDFGSIVGGAEKIAINTAIGLAKRRYNVIYFCAVGPIDQEMIDLGVNVICLNQNDIRHKQNKFKDAFRILNNKEAKNRFVELLKNYSTDDTVIHIHNWTKGVSSSIFSATKKFNFKTFITIHDYFLACPNGGLFNYSNNKICELKPMSMKCILCNCDSRNYLQKLFRVKRMSIQNKNLKGNNNLYYIFISDFSKRQFLKRNNYLDKNHQLYLTNMIQFEKNRFRVNVENNDVYLYIGALSESKGIRIFCEAITNTNTKGIVIGTGPLKEKLIEKYPNISFVGWKNRQEIIEYYKIARCLIFPSLWYETMGLTPLEAMAYGIPVICSNLCAAVDYVSKELLYDGNNAVCLENAIRKTLDGYDIEKKSKEIYANFDINLFSSNRYFSELENIYEVVEDKTVEGKQN